MGRAEGTLEDVTFEKEIFGKSNWAKFKMY
jgi:hypothetical protein